MSDVPKVHTAEPLVPLSDDEIAYRAGLPSWTLTQALFQLSGHKPPWYESARHMQDHFWSAYHHARLAIRQGDLCQKTEEAGERVFFDRPARWLAWADSLGLECIEVDDRVRRALSQPVGTGAPGRPNASYRVLDELNRREAAGEQVPDNLAKTACELHGWWEKNRGDAPSLTKKTIENVIRDRYRDISAGRKAAK